jgi:hypothetical protein
MFPASWLVRRALSGASGNRVGAEKVEYFRNISGEHPDWDEYREAMVKQGKSIIRVTPERWGRSPRADSRPGSPRTEDPGPPEPCPEGLPSRTCGLPENPRALREPETEAWGGGVITAHESFWESRLRRALADGGSGPVLVLVEGAAGTGKSHLLKEQHRA